MKLRSNSRTAPPGRRSDPEAVVPEPQEGMPVFTLELYYDNIKDTVTDEMRDRIKSRFKKRKTC